MRRAVSLALALAALLACAGAARAIAVAASPTTASVSVTLNGDDQVATFTIRSTVTSTPSTGWSLSAYAAAPTGTPGTLSPLTVTGLSSASCGNGRCNVSVPTSAITSLSWPISLGTTAGTATKFWNADVGTGDNKNQYVDTDFGVPVTADEFPGTYTTTLNITVAATP
jgi:hypothetical protein